MSERAHLDSAALRSATGLDQGARHLILKVTEEVARLRQVHSPVPSLVVSWYFQDRFGRISDYFAAVQDVWGYAARFNLERASAEARANAEHPLDLSTLPTRESVEAAGAAALLYEMPEPDFRLAVEVTLSCLEMLDAAAERITMICRNRGIPWRVHPDHGWSWVGDALVEQEVLRPALSALNDPRFAGSVHNEFEQARLELRAGTPAARKQALVEAAKAVESAMKIVLAARGLPHATTDGAQKLFEHLRDAGLVEQDTECLLVSAPRPRNSRAAHGDGPVVQEVRQDEAEAFVAGAATAVCFLHKLLP